MTAYYRIESVDCDHTRSVCAARYASVRQARKQYEKDLESAEGPLMYERISRADYIQMKSEGHHRVRYY